MRNFLTLACTLWLLAAAPLALGEVCIEQWGGDGLVAYPKTMTVDGQTVTFDLSALPKDAKVQSARLLCFRAPPDFDDEEALADPEVLAGTRKLELIGPWFDSFAVPADAIAGGKAVFTVKTLPGWQADKTILEIAYEGSSPLAKQGDKLPAVASVAAVHESGQTFITFAEIEKLLPDAPTYGEVLKVRQALDAKRRVRYRIYRHTEAITPANLLAAERLAEVEPLSGWNIDGRSPDQAFMIMRKRMLTDLPYAVEVSQNSYAIPQSAHEAVVIDRFVIPKGENKPIANGTGMYVHHPNKAGKAFYYAVTVVLNGQENVAGVKSTVRGGYEKSALGQPVFQGDMDMKVLFDYAGRRLQYVQWIAPPLSNRPNQYRNWGVFIPGSKTGVPLELHLSGSDMWRRPRWPHRLDTIMISPSDDEFGQGFYYGYPESAGTLKGLKSGTIQPYTWRRMLAFVGWLGWELRLEVHQSEPTINDAAISLSGDRGRSATGALHLAMRHPEVFSLVYTCKGMPHPAEMPLVRDSYGRKVRTDTYYLQKVLGKIEWGLKTDTGENVWEFFDLAPAIAAKPEVVLPMLSYGGRGGADWPPIAKMLEALKDARQPVISEGNWGSVDPPGVKNPGAGRAGLLVRRDRPIPVFTNHSGDYQGGKNGDGGATNLGVWWDDASIVDTPEKFEIVLTGGGTADVTPRRLSKFAIKPGEKIAFQAVPQGPSGDRAPKPSSGDVTADKLGLVTIPKVPIGGTTKLTLTRSAP